MRDWLEAIRMDYPSLFWSSSVLGCVLLVVAGFTALPDSPMFRAMGITGVQHRLVALRHGVYWSARAALHSTAKAEDPVVFYGNMEGVDASGLLVVSTPSGNKWVRQFVAFADVLLTDMTGVSQQVNSLRFENVRVEVYPGNQAVVWVRSAPLNVMLIEAGVAQPDPSPPTDIVDAAFAAYYWGIVKGKSS